MKILVVDDNANNRYLLEVVLRARGHEVEGARDGVEALERLRRDPVDAVISDVLMPRMDGYRLCRELRKDDALRSLPIVLVTAAYTDDRDEQLAREIGADRFVRRPTEPEAVASIVERVALDRRGTVPPPAEDKEYLEQYSERVQHQLERKLHELEAQIEDRKRAEAALRDSEERFRSIFDGSYDPILLLDRGGLFDGNGRAREAFGLAAEGPIQRRSLAELSPPQQPDGADSIAAVDAHVSSAFEHGTHRFEWVFRRATGALFPADVVMSAFEHRGARVLTATVRDITERRQAEESRAQLAAIVESTADAILRLTPVGVISAWNAGAERTYGYPADEAIGRNIVELAPPEAVDDVRETLARVARGGEIVNHDSVRVRKDGRQIDVSVTLSPILDRGKVVALASIARDVTVAKQDERQLRRINRALKTQSRCNQTLVQAKSEHELLEEMCRTLVLEGGYRLAWVGWVEHDEARSIRPTARFGDDHGYVDRVNVTSADVERGRGPIGTAARTGRLQVNQDFDANPATAPWREAALACGYHASIALPLLDGGDVLGVLAIYAAERDAFDEQEVALLDGFATDLAYGIRALRTRAERDRVTEERQHYLDKVRKTLEDAITAIAATVELRDPYTAGHQRRVAQLSAAIATELGLAAQQIEGLRMTGVLHDLGKLTVPAEILSKPARLSPAELGLVRLHAAAGYEILKGIEFPWPVANVVAQHHERLDGSGYPRGLRGEELLLEARILAVADVVEAMMSHRPYRPAFALDAALGEIERARGTQFDAAAVDACVRLFRERHFAFAE